MEMLRSVMPIEQIVALLTAERDRLSRAIDALQGGATHPAGTPGSVPPSAPAVNGTPKKRKISAAGRKRIAEAARRRWAAIRAGKVAPAKKSPAKKS